MGNYQTVKIEREQGVTWVILNRPKKRNAMNPQMHYEMDEVISNLSLDRETQVLVLTGAGEAFCAGMDLKEYFRALDNDPEEQIRVRWAMRNWNYFRLRMCPKPTIAAVNGWCFGGGFTPLVSCDLAIAADEAVFGLSEVNWGILPGGYVTRDVAMVMNYRDALYYILTGKTFDGQKAVHLGLVNESVPRSQLRDRVMALANDLKKINPLTLRHAKEAFKMSRDMNFEQAYDYLAAKNDQLSFRDPEGGRDEGIKQFIDDKKYKPGLGPYKRSE
ncbi:MAG: p-hydroxycinnamoyl CoA hydratase/lyase [Acidobacteria bacterium]|nr:p-hydroxycinnamoyl CoA hydratase/lyase [Acidobacteriota bacterium]